MAYLRCLDPEVQAHGNGGQHIGNVVGAYEMALYTVRSTLAPHLPLKTEERGAAHHPAHHFGWLGGIG